MESFNEETLNRIKKNDPTLKVLRITDIATPNPNHGYVGAYVPGNGSVEIANLGDSIGKNTCLESLCVNGDPQGLFGDDPTTTTVRALFSDGIQRNTSIRKLSLCRCDLSEEEGTAREILKAFGEYNGRAGNNLISISLQRCILVNGGVCMLASTLSTCVNIQYIKITETQGNLRLHDGLPFLLNHVVDESLPKLITAIKGCRKLEELDLDQNDIIGSAGCKALARMLEDPDCNLVTLRLENNLLGEKCATVLADALAHNKKLEKLYLRGNPLFCRSGEFEHAFSKIVCNTSTINDTYFSNHTLRSFAPCSDLSVPPYLELNCSGRDSKQIAIQKILRYHLLIDMEPFFGLDLKILPIAIRWFEMARRCGAEDIIVIADKQKLTAIHQFVIAMPMMFVPVSTATRIIPRKAGRS